MARVNVAPLATLRPVIRGPLVRVGPLGQRGLTKQHRGPLDYPQDRGLRGSKVRPVIREQWEQVGPKGLRE